MSEVAPVLILSPRLFPRLSLAIRSEIGLMIGYCTDLLEKKFGWIKRTSYLFSQLIHVVSIQVALP